MTGGQCCDWDTVGSEHHGVELCFHRGCDDALDSVDNEERVPDLGRVWACGLGLWNGDGLTFECAAQRRDVYRAVAAFDHRVPRVQGVHAKEDVRSEASDYVSPHGHHLTIEWDVRANKAQDDKWRAVSRVGPTDVVQHWERREYAGGV